MNSSTYSERIFGYLKIHKVSLSVFLAGCGTVYLASVILTGWSIFDWGKDVSPMPPLANSGLLPRGFINPIFFVTSFPALIIGTIALCTYSIRGISANASNHKEHVAMLLAAFGFAYCVVGAWPLGVKANFPWEWQKGIVSNGVVFAWTLYLLGVAALAIGGASLYIHSKIYSQKHPELSLEDAQMLD